MKMLNSLIDYRILSVREKLVIAYSYYSFGKSLCLILLNRGRQKGRHCFGIDIERCGWYFIAETLPFLLRSSFLFEEGVTPLMLQLLGYAICEMKTAPSSSPQKGKKDKDKEKEKSKSKEKEKEKEKEKDKDKDKDKDKTAGWWKKSRCCSNVQTWVEDCQTCF